MVRNILIGVGALAAVVLIGVSASSLVSREDQGGSLTKGPSTSTPTTSTPRPRPAPPKPPADDPTLTLKVTAPDGYQLVPMPGDENLQQFVLRPAGDDDTRPEVSVTLVLADKAITANQLREPYETLRRQGGQTGPRITTSPIQISGAEGTLYAMDHVLYKRARVAAVAARFGAALTVESSVGRGQRDKAREAVELVSRSHVSVARER